MNCHSLLELCSVPPKEKVRIQKCHTWLCQTTNTTLFLRHSLSKMNKEMYNLLLPQGVLPKSSAFQLHEKL